MSAAAMRHRTLLLRKAAFICTEKNTSLIQEGGLKNGQKILFY